MARALFAYDLGSPYAWLTAERIDALLDPPPEWLPVLLGGVFRATGRSSWARTDRRAAGIAEIEQRARERGLPPLRWPDVWPNDGLMAMRAATYAHAQGAGRAFALAAFRVQFTEGRALSDRDAVGAAAKRAGLDPGAVLAATGDPAVKDALREATDRALGLDVTGVPTVVAGGVAVWGDDRLEDAARLARGEQL
jgi:2-hydroxychromene-2-carboxylate isomerase